MPGGGQLTISCRNHTLSESSSPDGLSGDFIVLKITDTGCGIPMSLLRKVFDPFFTTKEPEKGTGLGLSQVYGFARRSGGTVLVDSEVERGTTVSIYLPRSHKPVRSEPSEEIPESKEQRDETILVVEDNAEVRAVTTTLLHELGYRTIEADSATSALERLDSGAEGALGLQGHCPARFDRWRIACAKDCFPISEYANFAYDRLCATHGHRGKASGPT